MNGKLTRQEIARVFNTERAIKAFEQLQSTVETTDTIVTAQIGDTGALQQATFVTLSANAELPNERVLAFGTGLDYTLTDTQIIIRLSSATPTITGGFRVQLVTTGDSIVGVPLTGILATRDNQEVLSNKELDGPTSLITGLGDYVDDAAAAVGLVPVGGLYRTASAVKVRVA